MLAGPSAAGLPALLRDLLDDFQKASGASILSLVLYDADADSYYAPFAVGMEDEALEDSLADMNGQLARYREDERQGKAPAELAVGHYGSTVWLTVRRRPLIARDARSEVDSSFVRRHGVEALIGLPLVAGGAFLGLLYLNYADRAHLPGEAELKDLEERAAAAAAGVHAAVSRAGGEGLAALQTVSSVLATGSHREALDEALGQLRQATGLTGLAIYQPDADGVSRRTAGAGAAGEAIAQLKLGGGDQGELHAYSSDRLALQRLAPAGRALLATAAELLGAFLTSLGLVASLEDANRVLGALRRMGNATLRPGASRAEVLAAVVQHLTDASVPEFDFEQAAVFLLEDSEGGLLVRTAVGTQPLDQNRSLAADDVLVFVAGEWRAVAIGSLGGDDQLLRGYRDEQVAEVKVPVVDPDGSVSAEIPAWVVEPTGRMPDPPFTLAGKVFHEKGHRDLDRIFVPFGLDRQRRASGVLELGYDKSRRRRLERTQVEALRAAAAQVAAAVETARLYEDARRQAERLALSAEVSKAIAASIDLEQTLRLVAGNLVRLVDASLCQIALYEEDGSGWYGAAASRDEEAWRRVRADRPERSFLFDVLDSRAPLLVTNVAAAPGVSTDYAQRFGMRSLLALPLIADGEPIGAAVLGQDESRVFGREDLELAEGLAHQAAVAIKNARLHAFAEEERHLDKDFVLVGFGMWGQKAYGHLQTLKQFFSFKVHVVQLDQPELREKLAGKVEEVAANGDAFYWDSPERPALAQLERELEGSSYVVTYIATPAATHLPTLAAYHPISNVIVIEKPLGAAPDEYRKFLDNAPGGVEIVAADHYYFKLEIRLLQQLLTEERSLRAFLDSVEEIKIEILEEQPLVGAAADIGVVADLIPHAFAIVSLFTPIGRIELDQEAPLLVGRQEPLRCERETFARMTGSFPYRDRRMRLVIDVGKGVENSKWIKLSDRQASGRGSFYKFDFGRGEAVDGTQPSVRAALRTVRRPGLPDNAHLTMLRHVIEKRRPAVGILSIRDALRSNQRVNELQALAAELVARGDWTPYEQGRRPDFGRSAVSVR